MRIQGTRIYLDSKITISKCALSMLGDMCNPLTLSEKEYGVYVDVKLQCFLATYFAYRPTKEGGYGRLASKAEVFRETKELEEWVTWDHLTNQPVSLVFVPNPNIAPKKGRK